MGALPKRKISKQRKGNRRSHNALAVPAVVLCPKCKKAKRPHFKCEYCGFYGKVEKKTVEKKVVVKKAKETVTEVAETKAE
jgi:large subunit ribosomal protein L32